MGCAVLKMPAFKARRSTQHSLDAGRCSWNTARRELDAIMEARNRAWLTSYADLWDPVRYPGLTGVRT